MLSNLSELLSLPGLSTALVSSLLLVQKRFQDPSYISTQDFLVLR